MLDFIRKIFYPSVTPMNTIHIDRNALISNLKVLQNRQPQMEIFPVVKSNAYGHGLKQVVQIREKTPIQYFVVDSYPEYMIVKKYSKKNILLLGETLPENYKFFDPKRVTFCVYNLQTLQMLGRRGKQLKVHIFINTGMYREGVNIHTIDQYIALLHKYPTITLEGILSHFHSADAEGVQSLQEQIQLFKQGYYKFLDAGYTPQYRYIANSAGMLKIQDEFFNAARPGLALYGYNPLKPTDACYEYGSKLKPALSIRSRIVAIQEVAQGQGISYEYQWIAPKATTIAVVPFGYAEGLSSIASNHCTFARKGKKIHQVGRITMNLTCIDVGNYAIELGDEIEIVSSKSDAHNSISTLATKSNTIIYEALVRLDAKIRRVII